MWAVTAELWRVLKPAGSLFVNLGDKRSGSGAPGTTSGLGPPRASKGDALVQGERSGITTGYMQDGFGRPKSKMLLPHRYAIGCEDGAADPERQGWIVRQDLVWSKRTGMPESVQDRTWDTHEYWFHMTKQERYFSAIDEIREPHATGTAERYVAGYGDRSRMNEERLTTGQDLGGDEWKINPLGRVPGSVWSIGTEPLIVPEHVGVRHFAAFPTEWPRRLILGWSPHTICTRCGDGRRPVTNTTFVKQRETSRMGPVGRHTANDETPRGMNKPGSPKGHNDVTIVGYACSCGAPEDGNSKPAVVLDPFAGTGTTVMVAEALGRHGVGVDMSADYLRIARWRTTDPTARRTVWRREAERLQQALF
jgi:hypothetical protein